MKSNSMPWLNILAAAIAITINILANALPINGQNTGEISDRFQVLFVPAGYVFAIWFLVYVGWLGFCAYQALPAQRDNPRLQRIGYLFIANCAANSLWILAWHYNQLALSVLIMLALLASLIAIYLRLDTGRSQASARERLLVDAPFSVYLGWISVATIANVTDLLWDWGWNGWGISPEVWAATMLFVALLLTGLMLITRRDVAFALVFVWAAVGIAVKQSSVALVSNAAWGVALLALIALAATWARPRGLLTRAS